MKAKEKTVMITNMNGCLNPLERLELEKAMLGRGVNYETIQLILSDFDIRIRYLHER